MIVFSKYFSPDEIESILCSCVPCVVASTSNVVTVFIGVNEKLALSILISIGLFCEIVEDGTKSLVMSNVKVYSIRYKRFSNSLLSLLFGMLILELIETLQNIYPEQALSSTLSLTFSRSELSVVLYCNLDVSMTRILTLLVLKKAFIDSTMCFTFRFKDEFDNVAVVLTVYE